jgi:tRNA-binding EMAP/Myf-like protein
MLPGATRPTELMTLSPVQTVPYESFARLDIRMGTVLTAGCLVHSKKLTTLGTDIGKPQTHRAITDSKRPCSPARFVSL